MLFKTLVSASAALLLPAAALANPINLVDYFSLTGTQFVTFDDLPGGDAPGTSYDMLVTSNGVGLGERFVGQTLGSNGLFDTLSGTPTGPLTLLAGAPGQNLNIFNYNGSNTLNGLGPRGFPDFDAIGEGAFALLFSTDQSQFGFQLVGGSGGSAIVSFFQANGSLIQEVTLGGLSDTYYGFAREGGVNDIRGISITNTDAGGIGFDNLKFDVASDLPVPGIPEPATWAMLIAGFGLVGIAARRRASVIG